MNKRNQNINRPVKVISDCFSPEPKLFWAIITMEYLEPLSNPSIVIFSNEV